MTRQTTSRSYPWRRLARLKFYAGALVMIAGKGFPAVVPSRAAEVSQVKGTITESHPPAKARGGSEFDLNASGDLYSVRVVEATMQPALGCRVISNFKDVYTTGAAVKPVAGRRAASLTHVRAGSLPTQPAWLRAQVLAFACVMAALPAGQPDDGLPAALIPQLVVASAKTEVAEVTARVLRRAGGSVQRVEFWGARPGTKVKTYANTADTFLLARLVLDEVVDRLPVKGEFTVYGKRPGLVGNLVSFERNTYRFAGSLGKNLAADAFSPSYDPASPSAIFVLDQRFADADGGAIRVYSLKATDEVPFDRTKLPGWRLVPPPKSGATSDRAGPPAAVPPVAP